jgi:WD repeat-containing protein 59
MAEDVRRGAIEHTLQAHTRAITDINFSAHHPDILSTCAVDGYVHCWDLRKPRRPVMTFCDWDAGATQVKWNRQDGHILASSHDRWLRIWDDRKGAYPLKSIEAHESKIYGVDWNRSRATGVVTCSLDKSIKFWDYANGNDAPERIIKTEFPVWRARHTPFGWGLLAMPQNAPGKLHLYDRRGGGIVTGVSTPEVATFPGHVDGKVKEFLWRSRGGIAEDNIDNREFQLVSWGEDNQLRLLHIEEEILEAVGYVKGTQLQQRLNITRKGAVYKTFRKVENFETEKRRSTIRGPRPWSSSMESASSNLSDSLNIMSLSKNHRGQRGAHGISMKGKTKEPVLRDHMDWITGIKIKSKDHDENGLPGGRLSLVSPNFDAEGEWETPESLHEEIVRVWKQYIKVTFEKVDFDERTLIISMNGPWGEGGESIYIKVNIDFPVQYPGSKLPNFTLGRTSLMPEETYEKVSREVRQIAAGFVGRRRGCLEAAICYLLGEVDLEDSTIWLTGSGDVDDLDGLADESSSEDDDNDMHPGTSAMMSQELDSSATEGMLIPIRRHANVPLPRLCGAKFATNGLLVCFFPPKEDKIKSLLSTVNLGKNRSKGEPYFNTFAHLRGDIPRNRLSSITDDDDGESSDSSRTSQESSSSESDSSQSHGGTACNFWRKVSYRKALSITRSQRSSGAGTGTGTGTGSRGRPPKPKNIISIHKVDDLVPAKQELAREYAIFGDGADVCNHNALVAQKYGFQDRADIWRYAAMLLEHEVPLEVLGRSHREEPILVIARDTIRHSRRYSGSDSGIDISDDRQSSHAILSGKVKWGFNPLAKCLIDDLFDHFEKAADVQMLAMLSCMFSEPSTSDELTRTEMMLDQPEVPLPMKTPGFSLDYLPSDAVALSLYNKTARDSLSTPKAFLTPAGAYGSIESSNEVLWGSDLASTSYSCGETPPMRTAPGGSEKLVQQAQSLSVSPEESRNFRRSNSGLASTFAASIARPFSTPIPSSPPNRKRPSPVESMLGSFASNAVAWNNTALLESVKEQTYSGRTSYSDDDTAIDDGKPLPATGIAVKMYNQDCFDDDGFMNTSLLDFNHAPLFSSYRRVYSELLSMWGSRLSSLEILKFDSLLNHMERPDTPLPATKSFTASTTSNNEPSSIDIPPPSPILLGKIEQMRAAAVQDSIGIDVTGYCLKHEVRLEPLPLGISVSVGGAVGRCERCKMVKSQLRCVICVEPIPEGYVPCLSCGCCTHEGCLKAYHAENERGCPGGCDCDCSAKAGLGVVESWEVMMGAIDLMRKLHGNGKRRKHEDWGSSEKEDWEKSESGVVTPSSPGFGKGYSTVSRRLGQAKAGEWGSGLRRRGGIARKGSVH